MISSNVLPMSVLRRVKAVLCVFKSNPDKACDNNKEPVGALFVLINGVVFQQNGTVA